MDSGTSDPSQMGRCAARNSSMFVSSPVKFAERATSSLSTSIWRRRTFFAGDFHTARISRKKLVCLKVGGRSEQLLHETEQVLEVVFGEVRLAIPTVFKNLNVGHLDPLARELVASA